MLPPLPDGYQMVSGTSCSGNIMLAFRGELEDESREVAIFVHAGDAAEWLLLERPKKVIVGRIRMNQLRDQVHRKGDFIAELYEELRRVQKNPAWGVF